MIIPVPISGGSDDLERRVSEGQHGITDLKESVRRLEQRVEKQALVLKAICSLLLERHVVSEADLLGRIQRLGEERSSEAARDCAACGRPMNLKHQKCLYCGAARRAASAIDLI
jgi:hypothetical protein